MVCIEAIRQLHNPPADLRAMSQFAKVVLDVVDQHSTTIR
jgi:hypothetical protein